MSKLSRIENAVQNLKKALMCLEDTNQIGATEAKSSINKAIQKLHDLSNRENTRKQMQIQENKKFAPQVKSETPKVSPNIALALKEINRMIDEEKKILADLENPQKPDSENNFMID